MSTCADAISPPNSMPGNRPMQKSDAARVQGAEARAGDGGVQQGGFAARAQGAAAKNAGGQQGGAGGQQGQQGQHKK